MNASFNFWKAVSVVKFHDSFFFPFLLRSCNSAVVSYEAAIEICEAKECLQVLYCLWCGSLKNSINLSFIHRFDVSILYPRKAIRILVELVFLP